MLMLALLAVFSMVFMRHVIDNNAREINRLYDETLIIGEIRPDPAAFDPSSEMGNLVRYGLIERLVHSEHISYVYYELGEPRAWLITPAEAEAGADIIRRETNWMAAASCFETFIGSGDEQQRSDLFGAVTGAWTRQLSLRFGEGFDESDFVYDGYGPIPLILNERILEQKSLAPGDDVYIFSSRRANARIIAAYTEAGAMGIARFYWAMTILPPNGLLSIRDNPSGTLVRFHINPSMNRDIHYFQAYMNRLFFSPGLGAGDIVMSIDDSVIRFVIAPLERNLELLLLLYPVVMVLVTVLAGGFAVLLHMQNAKTAAIMRAMGASKRCTSLVLGGEYLIICLTGIFLVFILAPLVGLVVTNVFFPVGLYFIGTLVGTGVGTAIITQRSPLDLLQVRE